MIALSNQQGPNPIQFITTRHEQGAAFMAYGNSVVSMHEGIKKINIIFNQIARN
jgi:thiamine pyrophosphate-dependent acetolactate synthase large subunit-like protein